MAAAGGMACRVTGSPGSLRHGDAGDVLVKNPTIAHSSCWRPPCLSQTRTSAPKHCKRRSPPCTRQIAALETRQSQRHRSQRGRRGPQHQRGEDVHGGVLTGDRNIQAGRKRHLRRERGDGDYPGEAPVTMTAVDPAEPLAGKHLHHIISRNRYLQLQGIRSGGRLVNIELDQIYITLRATQQRHRTAETQWLQAEAGLGPGRAQNDRAGGTGSTVETVTVSVNEALDDPLALVVLGDPGSGKTDPAALNLALLYARDMAEIDCLVEQAWNCWPATGNLPLLLPLRQIGAYLKTHHGVEDGTDGHAMMLAIIYSALKNEQIDLPISSTPG